MLQFHCGRDLKARSIHQLLHDMYRGTLAGIDFASVTVQRKLQEPCIAQSLLVPCKILCSVLAYTVKLAAINAVEKLRNKDRLVSFGN